jgi:hypothetical protein
MRRRAQRLLSVALLAAATGAVGANDEWPRDTVFEGPLRFCSPYFAVDVPSGENVRVRDPGLDFLIIYFESGDRWLGAYEGNHPQTNDKDIERFRSLGNTRVDRMTATDDKTSYLIHAVAGQHPVYLHVFSDQFTGVEADHALLQRFVIGGFDKTGCSSRTYQRS